MFGDEAACVREMAPSAALVPGKRETKWVTLWPQGKDPRDCEIIEEQQLAAPEWHSCQLRLLQEGHALKDPRPQEAPTYQTPREARRGIVQHATSVAGPHI